MTEMLKEATEHRFLRNLMPARSRLRLPYPTVDHGRGVSLSLKIGHVYVHGVAE